MKRLKNIVVLLLFLCLLAWGGLGIEHIESETFALSDYQPKLFLYRPLKIQRVYQYSKSGEIIEYKSGKDYEVNYINGTIRRTENSSIPDYTEHTVLYDKDGNFSFSSEPRNPELNIEYQVLVDYTTFFSPLRSVSPRKGLEKTILKLKSGEDVKILLCGDSIAAGAQTTGLYYYDDHMKTTFFGLTDSFIEDNYDVNCDAVLYGEDGTSLQFMMDNIEKIVAEQPDMVMIEFGMNDHLGADAMNRTDKFREDLSYCVTFLKDSKIDVLLIGFFQQNTDWVEENQEATKAYNNVIEEVAREHNVPFADVYTKWQSIARKMMIEDMTSDYMHHPTDFGHKVYFSEIVPFFMEKEMRSVRNYLY